MILGDISAAEPSSGSGAAHTVRKTHAGILEPGTFHGLAAPHRGHFGEWGVYVLFLHVQQESGSQNSADESGRS